MYRRTVGTLISTLALLAAAAGVTTAGVSASSTCSGKCALGNLVPTSVGAGASEAYTFTLTNEASPQSLGSADLTVPSGFVDQSIIPSSFSDPDSTSATATVLAGTTLELRNLDLAPGDEASVGLQVSAPCSANTYDWSLLAKQANSFNGPPGNDFTIDSASSLTTTVTGSCSLQFVSTNEPANAVVTEDVTTVGFSQALGESAAPVEVEALDGATPPQRVPGVQVQLSLASVAGGGTGSLSGTTTSTTGLAGTASAGIASFSQISIDHTGYYQVEATAPGFPQPAYSSGFQIASSATPCVSSCSGGVPEGNKTAGLTVTVSGVTGADILSVGQGGLSYGCPGYAAVSGSFGVDVWTSGGTGIDTTSPLTQQVTIEVPKYLVTLSPNNGASFYQICYASTTSFPGYTSTVSVTGGGGSLTLYVGLLPDCNPSTGAPCVVSRNKNGGNVLITFYGAPGDFWGQT